MNLSKGQQVVGRIAKPAVSHDIHKPMGVSEYQLKQSLCENLKPGLLRMEDIERGLEGWRK